jgi:tetratricopeptide (TPR) repeat protein
VLAAHALALLATWRPEEAISRCEEAIRIARAVGDRAEEARGLNILGGCLTDLGEMDRAIGLLLEARRIAEEVGEAETVVRTYVDLCYALALAGRGQDALADAQEGYLRACQLGLEHATGSLVAAALAWQLLDSGRWDECERLLGSCFRRIAGTPSSCTASKAGCSPGEVPSQQLERRTAWRCS